MGRELDQNIWMVKQVLHVGVHGIIFPTVETPEQALMAIRAMRYPQRLGAPDQEPAGLRGTNPRLAARYWGLSVPDYIERAGRLAAGSAERPIHIGVVERIQVGR